MKGKIVVERVSKNKNERGWTASFDIIGKKNKSYYIREYRNGVLRKVSDPYNDEGMARIMMNICLTSGKDGISEQEADSKTMRH